MVEIHLLTGDNPALTKLLMLKQTSAARRPCPHCKMINCLHQHKFANDPGNWENERTTQLSFEREILNLRQGTLDVRDSGMGEKNQVLPNPMFLYFHEWAERYGLGAIKVRGLDLMHQIFLGVVKLIGTVLADVVIDYNENLTFRQTVKQMHDACIRGESLSF
mgnify:CR=1 FL=1